MPIYNGIYNQQHLQSVGPMLPVEVHPPTALTNLLAARQLPIPAPITGAALIDTGATTSCVDDSIMIQLGVNPIRTQVMGGAAGANTHFIYPAKLVFPGNITFDFSAMASVHISSMSAPGSLPLIVLIGRDILAHCLFLYNGTTGTYSLALDH